MGKKTRVEKTTDRLLQKILDIGGLHIVEAAIDRRNLRDVYVERRKFLGMTQQEMADKLGLSLAHVVKWETGDWPDVRLSLLRRYSMVLGLLNHYDIRDTTPLPEPEEA